VGAIAAFLVPSRRRRLGEVPAEVEAPAEPALEAAA
jgi:hypothetical protein